MAKACRKILVWCVTIFAVVSLAGLIYDFGPKHFHPKRWQSGSEISRGSMVKDLIERRILIGRTRTEVIELLGEPDYCLRNNKFLDCKDEKSDAFEYRFNGRRCHPIWGCTMDIHFEASSQIADSTFISSDR